LPRCTGKTPLTRLKLKGFDLGFKKCSKQTPLLNRNGIKRYYAMKKWLIVIMVLSMGSGPVARANALETALPDDTTTLSAPLPSTLTPLITELNAETEPTAEVDAIKPDTTKSDTPKPETKQPETKPKDDKKGKSAKVAVLPSTLQPLKGYVDVVTDTLVKPGIKPGRTIDVPAETVMQVSITETLNTNHSQVGDTVTATVKDPVFIGPYEAVPAGSTLEGTVSGVNKRAIKQGPNPYILVDFTRLTRSGETEPVPINAQLIAYKTGLKKEDYLWKLPRKTSPIKKQLGNAAQGALVGFLANPLFGPVIGAGAGVAMGLTVDKVAQRSSIRIKPGDVIPIAVQDAFKVSVVADASTER
jgi:hypothetical protein